MKFSRIVQLFLGIIIGLLLIAGGTAAAGYYFLSRLAEVPPRPVFPEELPKQPEPKAEESPAKKQEQPDKQEKPEEKKPAPEPSPQEPEKLEPGAYKARVTWPDGLSLRDNPSKSANRIGGVAYNRELIILKKSEDGQWQKVRIPGSNQEGWVKAGNAEKVE